MTRIILVRHGETAWNKESRLQGQTDVPLNEVGRRQADLVAQRLDAEPITAAYASDLSRAHETAVVIAKRHQLEVIPVIGLREVSFGEWEGLSRATIREYHEVEYQRWLDNPMEVSPPGGETFSQVQARAHAALIQIASAHPDETILIVAHGGMIKSIICKYHEGGFWDFPQGNTAVNFLEFAEGEIHFLKLNDCEHLEGMN